MSLQEFTSLVDGQKVLLVAHSQDEADRLAPGLLKQKLDRERRMLPPKKMRAIFGWPNWYINRGRMSLHATPKERRAVSWRRAF